MNKLAGTYSTRNGLPYDYDATWHFFGHAALWDASVRRGDEVFAIDGSISLAGASVDVEAAVRLSIERRIEAGQLG